MNNPSQPENRHSLGATLLLLMVLSVSVWGAIRFVAALRSWNVLYEFKSSLSPLYLSITGAGWAAAGCVLLFSIWRVKTWARPAIFFAVLAWLMEYWVERIFFQSVRANLLFALTCSIVFIGMAWIAASLPGTKSFFTQSEEHEQPFKKPNPE